MITLNSYIQKRYSVRNIQFKLVLPFDAKLAELSGNTAEGYSEEKFTSLCKEVEIYLNELFSIDGILNIYTLREFFEFNKAEIYPEDLVKAIRADSESYFSGADSSPEAIPPDKLSVVSDYFKLDK